jgi:translation initiation factor 1 (eIF-1/SUI1)
LDKTGDEVKNVSTTLQESLKKIADNIKVDVCCGCTIL